MAIDAAVNCGRHATTEEAYIFLVRFGQISTGGEALENFARRAERMVIFRSPPFASAAIGCTAVKSHADRDGEADVNDEPGPTSAVMSKVALKEHGEQGVQKLLTENKRNGQNESDSSGGSGEAVEKGYEAASVLLNSEEIGTLATELDPLRQVDRAFAVLETAFGTGTSIDNCHRRHRSPLQSYALSRCCRSWHKDLVTTGNTLLTTRLKLGRRGLDLLLAGTTMTTTPDSVAHPPPVVTEAAEVIAEAAALAPTAVRSQVMHTTDSGGGGIHPSSVVHTARAYFHSPLPDFSTRGIQGFDGRGYYDFPPVPQRMGRTAVAIISGVEESKEAGEPVAVLEISSDRARQTVNVDGKTFGEHMTFVASLLSISSLRKHPNLINFHPGARVVLDARGSAASAGGGDCAAGGVPMHIVCERLQGWRPLCDVILEHGPLAPQMEVAGSEDSGGLRILRLWGSQIASVLELLGSQSIVLRDLRSSTVFVSPDGSTLKVVAFSSLTTLASDGRIAGESHALDHAIHGPTKPWTPPEAFTTRKPDVPYGVAGSEAVYTALEPKDAETLHLVDSEQPGVFPASAMWDVWTFGVLLFELAFGHPPPSYGSSLGRAVALSIETAAEQGVSPPEVEDVARTIQYDYLSTIHGLAGGGKGTATTADPAVSTTTGDKPVIPSQPLADALRRMSLGASMGVREEFHVSPIVRPLGAGSGCDPEWVARDDDRVAVVRFQQAWVRRQLEMEECGRVDLITPLQTFQEKLKKHLDLSIAAPAGAVPFSQSMLDTEEASSLDGDEGGGGTRTISFIDGRYGGKAATTPMKRRTPAAVTAVDRIIARLREADSTGTGWLPFRVMLGLLQDELQLSCSTGEADMIIACLRDGAPSRDRGLFGDGKKTWGQHPSPQDDEVFYQPLVHVLRESLTHVSNHTPSHVSDVGGASSSPTPAAFAELLCLCMEPDPARRPCPTDILRLPFFSGGGGGGGFAADALSKEEKQQNGLDLAAAAMYLSGAGNDCSPTLTLRNRVERPIQALETASLEGRNKTTNVDPRCRRASGAMPGRSVAGIDATASLGAGTLAVALKELERLVHRSSAHELVEDPQQARMVSRGHANVVDEIFESELLVRVSALALRFLDQEEVRFIRNLPTKESALS